jgi:DNA-binding IclR family transcriptional regulator
LIDAAANEWKVPAAECIAVTRMDRQRRLLASPNVSALTAHARGGRRRSWNQARYLLIFSRCAAGA